MSPLVYFLPRLPVDQIRQSEKGQYDPGHFDRLKESISKSGLKNPLIGVTASGMIQVGPGKQRLQALLELGHDHIPVVVWDKEKSIDRKSWQGHYGATIPMHEPDTIMRLFDKDHDIDLNSWHRGWLAIKKTKNWRDQ